MCLDHGRLVALYAAMLDADFRVESPACEQQLSSANAFSVMALVTASVTFGLIISDWYSRGARKDRLSGLDALRSMRSGRKASERRSKPSIHFTVIPTRRIIDRLKHNSILVSMGWTNHETVLAIVKELQGVPEVSRSFGFPGIAEEVTTTNKCSRLSRHA